MAVLNSVVVVTSTSPVLLISLVTVKLLVIVTLLFGISTSPVPFARNSKLVFDVVVVMKLSSINISSNCTSWLTSICPVTVELLTDASPVCV